MLSLYNITSFILIIAFLAIYLFMLKKVPNLLFIFMIFNAHFTQILSCFSIELLGLYITEQGQFGFKTGATIRLLVYEYIFLISFVLYSYLLCSKSRMVYLYNKHKDIRNINYLKFYNIVWMVLLVLLVNVLTSREIPFFSNVATRFNFWPNYSRLPFLVNIFGTLSVFIPIYLGLYKYDKSVLKIGNESCAKSANIIFYCYLAYLVLVGQKAGGLIIACYLFIILRLYNSIIIDAKLITKRSVVNFLTAFSIVAALINYYYKNSGIGNYFDGNVLFAALYRIFGLQGHVWWGTDYLVISSNVRTGFFNMIDGMTRLMLLVSGNKGQAFVDENIRFANANPAIILYSFGYLGGAIIQVFFGVVLSVVVNRIIMDILKKKYILAFIMMQILFWLNSFYINGDLSVVYSIKMIFAVSLYFVLLSRILCLGDTRKIYQKSVV